MPEVQIGLIAAASLAADLVERCSGPSEVVAIAVQAEVVDSGRVETVATGCAGLAAPKLALVGRWLVVVFEACSYAAGVAFAVLAAAE